MNGSFDPHPKNFGELLGQYEKRPIVVPQFQRGYSWEKTHVAAFWEDLKAFHDGKSRASSPKKYFLGPIVILPESDKQVLLDGQQRLATATVLFSVVRDIARTEIATDKAKDLARDIQRDLISKDEDKGSCSLSLGDTDRAYFQRTVQSDPPANDKAVLRSHKLIETAKQYIRGAVLDLITGKKADEQVKALKSIVDTAATDMMMVAISVRSEDDAYRIFETLNDRGLRLSVPDLLLNFLMRKASNEGERSQIREKWSGMLERMGRRDIDRFLRHMWLSKYGDLKARGLFHEMKEHLETHKISSLEFAETCSDECDAYVSLVELDESALGKALTNVTGLVRHLQIQSALPLLLSGLRCLSPHYYGRLAELTASLAVRHAVISNLNPSDLESAYYSAARELRHQKDAKATDARSVNAVRTILAKVDPDDVTVLNAIDNTFLTKPQARYILSTIANSLQSKTKEIGIDDGTVEHIFPEKPGPAWKNSADLADYLGHVGNLTLLGGKLNEKAANEGFADKRKKVYSKSEIEMTRQVAESYTTWTPADVLDRAKSLGKLAVALWKPLK